MITTAIIMLSIGVPGAIIAAYILGRGHAGQRIAQSYSRGYSTGVHERGKASQGGYEEGYNHGHADGVKDGRDALTLTADELSNSVAAWCRQESFLNIQELTQELRRHRIYIEVL